MAAAVVFPNMPEFDPPTNAIHFQKMTSLKGTPRGPTWLNRKSLSQQQQSRGNEVAPEPERRITSTITWTAPESQGKTIQNKFKSEIIFLIFNTIPTSFFQSTKRLLQICKTQF